VQNILPGQLGIELFPLGFETGNVGFQHLLDVILTVELLDTPGQLGVLPELPGDTEVALNLADQRQARFGFDLPAGVPVDNGAEQRGALWIAAEILCDVAHLRASDVVAQQAYRWPCRAPPAPPCRQRALPGSA